MSANKTFTSNRSHLAVQIDVCLSRLHGINIPKILQASVIWNENSKRKKYELIQTSQETKKW